MQGGDSVDIRVNDELVMKKPHPCGGNRFSVLRVGMDFRLRCIGCGHEMMIPRKKAERNIKAVFREGERIESGVKNQESGTIVR
jgi:hypothetical protein